MDSCPCPRTLHSCLQDSCVEWKNDVVELDFQTFGVEGFAWWKRNSKQGADVPAESSGTPPIAFDVGFAMTRRSAANSKRFGGNDPFVF